MYSFKQYLSESKNTHLEHLEDEIINNGYQGGVNAVEFLKSLRNMLVGSSGRKVNVSVKWDGAPAVFCGVNPENGKFFVGSKSVFNVTPKINYTPADIRKNHTGGLADKLQVALRELRKLNIKGVVQGDFLYTPDEIKTATIRGEKVILLHLTQSHTQYLKIQILQVEYLNLKWVLFFIHHTQVERCQI